jgi:hypothetical protein
MQLNQNLISELTVFSKFDTLEASGAKPFKVKID